MAHSTAFCALPPPTQCQGDPEGSARVGEGRRALSRRRRERYCGREKAGSETTAAGLAVASVSEQVSGRSKCGM